ncbi:hypothetical protein T484DRAFT_2431352 [Baffinella frigidus]|nr:hypothetical protein T484DRAFT_2431352 [Cryptophyta sp. CCMP2293]
MWTLGGTAFWSCWACLEPCWPWILRKRSYILSPPPRLPRQNPQEKMDDMYITKILKVAYGKFRLRAHHCPNSQNWLIKSRL